MRRSITTAIALILAATVGSAGVAGAGAPRMPRNAADWATFSSSEKAAGLNYERRTFEASLANGTAKIQRVLARTQVSSPIGVNVTASGSCGFQVSVQGIGRNVKGGGTTDASAVIDLIYASKLNEQGQFFRDGNLVENWWNSRADSAHAELECVEPQLDVGTLDVQG